MVHIFRQNNIVVIHSTWTYLTHLPKRCQHVIFFFLIKTAQVFSADIGSLSPTSSNASQGRGNRIVNMASLHQFRGTKHAARKTLYEYLWCRCQSKLYLCMCYKWLPKKKKLLKVDIFEAGLGKKWRAEMFLKQPLKSFQHSQIRFYSLYPTFSIASVHCAL